MACEDEVRRTRGVRDTSAALTLFGVTFSEPAGHGASVSGTELVVVRELAAIVGPGKYAAVDPTHEEATALARAVVGAGPDAPALLRAAADTVWGLSRDEHRSATPRS